MRKAILTLCLLPLIFTAAAQKSAQKTPVEIFLEDSLMGRKFNPSQYLLPNRKMAFFCTRWGALTSAENADFLRVSYIDSLFYVQHGAFKEYYILDVPDKKGQKESQTLSPDKKLTDKNSLLSLARVGYYNNGVKEGNFVYYHSNGNLKAKGSYKKGWKVGTWEFFYENGMKYKIVRFEEDGRESLIEFKDKKGKYKIKEGNGKFKEVLTIHDGASKQVQLKGNVLNGKPDGKWRGYLMSTRDLYFVEKYDQGKLIEGRIPGESDYVLYKDVNYTEGPKVAFSGVDNFLELKMYKDIYYPPAQFNAMKQFSYKKGYYRPFYEEIKQGLSEIIQNRNDTINGYFLVYSKIPGEGKLKDVSYFSNLNDPVLEGQLEKLIAATEQWKVHPKTKDRPVDPDLSFQIVVINNKVYIPKLIN